MLKDIINVHFHSERNDSMKSAPVHYTGDELVNLEYHHVQLRPVVGVQNCQVIRANRRHPEWVEDYGWTYNHAPMLAYWNGKFYLEYLSNPVGEHIPPGHTLMAKSEDGIHWTKPELVFPKIIIPNGIYQGPYKEELKENTYAVMHQRMGFYVASNGKLLVLGFYTVSVRPEVMPNNGYGMGRVVREVHQDGSLGPIYFIRYNRHAGWDETNIIDYPFYDRSNDKEFKKACENLLEDKLATLQWWEEDRSQDGFYAVEGYKALCYYHLDDSRVVGLWKWSRTSISEDEGQSWQPVTYVPSLVMAGGKIWGQRTSDGKFAAMYNPSTDGNHRWPLGIVTSEDGLNFNHMCAVLGDVSPLRYAGKYKDFGFNYVRGIAEGNGNTPDGDIWVTYSMNKEDIWVTKVPVPVRWSIDAPVNDNFNDLMTHGEVTNWNIHSSIWASVSVEEFPSNIDKSIRLMDKDPYESAIASRIFPESKKVVIKFKVMAKQSDHGTLEIELVDSKSRWAFRVFFDGHGFINLRFGDGNKKLVEYLSDQWYNFEISINAVTHYFNIMINGESSEKSGWCFVNPVNTLERIIFRTGPLRNNPNIEMDVEEEDLINSEEPIEMAEYYLNFFQTIHTGSEVEQKTNDLMK